MSSLRSIANEATSSAGNMQTDGSSVKRKRSENNCHQCHKNDKEAVHGCTKCKKKYCILCITRWYPKLDITDVVEACPVCRNICNCAACLKPDVANKNFPIPDLKLCTAKQIMHNHDVLRVLLPFLKKFVAEENSERNEEARIQGLSITELHVSKSNLGHNVHALCNNCKSSIMDVHRSCLNCFFMLCVRCCIEIRSSSPGANQRYPVHGDDRSRVVAEWTVTNNGSIVCPPQSLGGCGCQNLELMSIYPTNWVSELLVKAEEVTHVGKVTDATEAFGVACLGSSQGIQVENATLLTHQEESNDNYLHCPTTFNINKNDLEHFEWHLRRGDPAVVPDCLSGAAGLSWEPMVMWRACRKPRKPYNNITKFKVINCRSWSEEIIGIHKFFSGYAEGLLDAEDRLKILKLEDWPPAESFQEHLPRHFLEFVRCLPFMLYTHPHAGHLNMITRIPLISRKVDLGPKMYICYGVCEEQGSSCLSMIHYAPSDMVNILMHTATICLSPEDLERVEKRSREIEEEVNSQMENVNGQKYPDPSISSSSAEGSKEPEGGAIWDIFRRQDVPKLEEYLRKHAGELKHTSILQQMVHPIHEKAFYLNVEHKRKLNEEYGVEPWTFVQRLGDAVFVPAGCPYQIRHLKSCTSVAFNFVSPESIGECVRLSAEYRCLPRNHRSKEDKLQVKQMTLHAVAGAVEYLEKFTPATSRSGVEPSLSDLVFMKQDMEEKMSILEKHGRLVAPDRKAFLQRSIQDFLNKVSKEMQKSLVKDSNEASSSKGKTKI